MSKLVLYITALITIIVSILLIIVSIITSKVFFPIFVLLILVAGWLLFIYTSLDKCNFKLHDDLPKSPVPYDNIQLIED